MISLNFPIQGVNHLLQLLGRLPFADVNGIINEIVTQAQPQADALNAAAEAAEQEEN